MLTVPYQRVSASMRWDRAHGLALDVTPRGARVQGHRPFLNGTSKPRRLLARIIPPPHHASKPEYITTSILSVDSIATYMPRHPATCRFLLVVRFSARDDGAHGRGVSLCRKLSSPPSRDCSSFSSFGLAVSSLSYRVSFCVPFLCLSIFSCCLIVCVLVPFLCLSRRVTSCIAQRSFGGILTENARHDAPVDNPGGAESAAGRRTQVGRVSGSTSPFTFAIAKPEGRVQQSRQACSSKESWEVASFLSWGSVLEPLRPDWCFLYAVPTAMRHTRRQAAPTSLLWSSVSARRKSKG